jgi:hypothetical protein
VDGVSDRKRAAVVAVIHAIVLNGLIHLVTIDAQVADTSLLDVIVQDDEVGVRVGELFELNVDPQPLPASMTRDLRRIWVAMAMPAGWNTIPSPAAAAASIALWIAAVSLVTPSTTAPKSGFLQFDVVDQYAGIEVRHGCPPWIEVVYGANSSPGGVLTQLCGYGRKGRKES